MSTAEAFSQVTRLISIQANNFINHKRFIHVYPLILALGTFLNTVVFSAESLERQKNNYYILHPGNIFNQVFAYKGNQIFAILFFFVFVINLTKELDSFHHDTTTFSIPGSYEQTLLPTTNMDITRNRKIIGIVKQYVIKFALKLFLLFVAFWVIDHIFVLTGGSCSIDKTVTSAEECYALGGKWKGGFDISGHFCFLVNLSLILWFELFLYNTKFDRVDELIDDDHDDFAGKLIGCIKATIITFLVGWIVILTITSIYFHTFFEKLLGLLFGYMCPLILYYMIPKNRTMNQLLYDA